MFRRLRFAGALWSLFLVGWVAGAEPSASDSSAPAVSKKDSDRPKAFSFRERLKDRAAAATAVDADLKRMTWTVGEVTREALVYVPAGEHESAHPPVVFLFHGHGGRPEHLVRKLALHKLWPEAVCVYPQGLPTPVPVIDVEGKMSGWQKYVGDQDDRDLAFFDAVLKTMQADHAVDAKRIYSTGHSNGGFFTYVLWSARGDLFAALAPIAGGLSPRDTMDRKPTPVLHVAGEQDRIVRFDTQRRTMDRVREINGCDATGRPAGEFCTEYRSAEGPPVVTFIHPGGHEVPDGAAPRIAEFFRANAKR